MQQGGLLAGIDYDNFRLDLMVHPMWWVSSEGAILLTVVGAVCFLALALCCPAPTYEESDGARDLPRGELRSPPSYQSRGSCARPDRPNAFRTESPPAHVSQKEACA